MSKEAILRIDPVHLLRALNLQPGVSVLSIHQGNPRFVGDGPIIEMHVECEDLPDVPYGMRLPVCQLVITFLKAASISTKLEVLE